MRHAEIIKKEEVEDLKYRALSSRIGQALKGRMTPSFQAVIRKLNKEKKMDVIKMLDQKGCFIRSLEAALLEDQKNNQVDCIQFRVLIHDENSYDEYLEIVFLNGHTKKILATGNSNGANLKAITKEVY